MFEHFFDLLHRITGNYYLTYVAAWMLSSVWEVVFLIRYYTKRGGRVIYLSEEESEKILQGVRPYSYSVAPARNMLLDEQIHLSIIIPAYNVEKYISDCLHSVFDQVTHFTYEVIVIDDGSTDATSAKLVELGNRDNLHIISQENGGISSARNRGLDHARGLYVMFVDSDDRLPPGAIQSLLSTAEANHADLVGGNYRRIGDEGGIGRPLWRKDFVIDLKDHPDFILQIKGYACMKIFARKLWNNIRFPQGLDFEDTVVTMIIFRMIQNFAYISQSVYEYRKHDASTVKRNIGKPRSLDSYYVVKTMIDESRRLGLQFNPTFYLLTLKQFGPLLYRRVKGLSPEVIDAMLVLSSGIMKDLDKFRPVHLSYDHRCLREALLNADRERWEIYCKFHY